MSCIRSGYIYSSGRTFITCNISCLDHVKSRDADAKNYGEITCNAACPHHGTFHIY